MENQPEKIVSIRHYGLLDGEQEITSGEEVEKWVGGLEVYKFEENNGITTVIVELDTLEDFTEHFQEQYPRALDKLKEICER